ncbi:MAG TPA: hypothetical protein PK715_17550, partial [Chitinophagales bacterium]|nr:hypothetical protein [Chitinophagales bacterium]
MNLYQIAFIIGICFFYSCIFQAHKENKHADKTFFAPENQPEAEPYYQFARRLENSIKEGNPNFFNDNFDLNLLVSNLLRKTGVPTKTGHIFAQEVLANIDAGTQIVTLLQGESNYKLLGISNLPSQPTVWFRITLNGVPDYHRIQLTVAPTVDLVRIQDFCIL